MSGRKRSARQQRRADLSQHFLREAAAARLIQTTSISNADLVYEVGAGRGALTKPLLKKAKQVIAVELDEYLADKLSRRFAERARVIHSDFLSLELPTAPYSVVGNIPYSRSTDIIRKLHTAPNPPSEAWVVVQRELAHRMCGKPFGNETLWSLRLKPFWHLEIVDQLAKSDFEPPPSIESVFLHMSFREKPIVSGSGADRYTELIELAFESGGPIGRGLRQNLSKIQLRRLAANYKFDPQGHAADLMFEQWLGIYRYLERKMD